MPRCDHKFIDSNYCAKCGVSVETLKAEQRTFFGVDVSADAPEPLKKFAQRTNAEQAVLDAMAAVPEETLRRSLWNMLHEPEHSRNPAAAELARRGLKP